MSFDKTAYMNRKALTPAQGNTYSNQGGGLYRCMKNNYNGTSVFQNIASGWTLTAHGCGIYPDGTIDWDFSTGGHFETVQKQRRILNHEL